MWEGTGLWCCDGLNLTMRGPAVASATSVSLATALCGRVGPISHLALVHFEIPVDAMAEVRAPPRAMRGPALG